MAVPLNPDLTPSNKIPGVYVYNLLNTAGAGDESEPFRVLLVGELLSTATKPPNVPFDLTSEQDASDWFGAKSTVRRQYRAAVAQVGEGNVRIGAIGLSEPSGGVAAIYRLAVAGPATAAGSARVQIAGEEVSVGYANGDSAATIKTALQTALGTLTRAPVSIGSIDSTTISITYNIKGAIGEDLPIRTYVTESSGVYLGPGDLVYTNAATGAGSATLSCGTQTCTASITGGDSAATVAASMKTALAADEFFVYGGTIATSTLPLYYRNGRDIRRIKASIVTSTVITATLSGGSATDGMGSASSYTYAGTQGTGAPTLTTALTALANGDVSYGEWTCPWTDSTSLGALATHIEAEASGEIQRNQHLTVCHVGTEATGATVITAPSPALNTSLRYIVGHCQDAGQQGYELAARRAAMMAAWSTPATSSNALPLKTTASVPLNLPALKVRPSRSTQKTALLDGLEPWVVVGGRLVVLRGRTASSSTDEPLWDPSYIRQFGLYRRELRIEGGETFGGTFVKADGVLNQPNQITEASVVAWAIGKQFEWENRGLYDGAEQLKSGVRAEINSDDRSRIDLVVPCSPVISFAQLGVVAARSAPSL